ncbi:MAG: hydrolase [Oscillospiraceae bacterium]|nr:hydrolase [Oscillospiraceae bacterium]
MINSENKERFLNIYEQYIKRQGADRLLEWMDNRTDFFTAPASTRYHGAFSEGLVIHSLNVYDILKKRNDQDNAHSDETIAVVSLLHDLCKANFYKETTRNVKNDITGQWEKVPYYSIDDPYPYGHGEKSVYLIERFMRLSPEEAIAIRWHMGGFDDSAHSGGFNIGNAFNKYPLAVKLHLSDLEATYLLET